MSGQSAAPGLHGDAEEYEELLPRPDMAVLRPTRVQNIEQSERDRRERDHSRSHYDAGEGRA